MMLIMTNNTQAKALAYPIEKCWNPLMYRYKVQNRVESTGAPVPPLVPGHVWVSGSSYDSGGRVITTWALDSPDDLSYNVLARPVLVNYAEMLNQWATEQRAKVTSGEPVTKL